MRPRPEVGIADPDAARVQSGAASKGVFMFGRKWVVAGFLAAAALASAANPGDPVAVIKKKDAELQKMLRDKEASKKTDRLKVLINGIFDFEELGKRALGPDTWKTMTPDQQKRFVKAFREMVENASVKKLEVYQSDSSTYEAPDVSDGKASVTAHVWTKGTESVVTYKLLAKDTTWKAWDLIIDDLSTARNYGEQFKKILQTSNIDGLIAKLEKKASGAAEAKPADNLKAKSEKGTAAAPAKAAPAKSAATPAKGPAAAAQVTNP
jgi:phospholipid transport system substrate-binding protein